MLKGKTSLAPLLFMALGAGASTFFWWAAGDATGRRGGQAHAEAPDAPRKPTRVVSAAAGALTEAKADSPEAKNPPAVGNRPSKYTIEAIKKARAALPFADKQDFEEQKRGFIASPKYKKIKAEAGHFAWDMERFEFLLGGKEFDSIHPSLERQSILNMNYGLYKVVDGIYQVRGFDLANITFVKGKTGWIVFDPMVSKETAKAALELVDEHLGKTPVVAVIYSHSHGDHFGGVRGVVDEADVRAGKVQIIAPRAFMEHAVSENVYAGNAMSRRLFYQYGALLPAGPEGYVGQGLGQGVSSGNIGLIAPTRVVEKDFETFAVDGVKMVFQNTPDTEAPSEMNTYIPELKALWVAENVTATLHNIYTLRGAQIRDPLKWSKYINQALYLYGKEADVMFASHHWPRWGSERIQEVLRGQRDLYAHMNNQVLHLANQGVTINQIHNVYELPKSIQNMWFCRGYHGSPQHNSRGVVNRYLGYWDCNPATLIPLSPSDSSPLYVELMGGADKILAKGKELFESGKYLLAVEILNKLVFAEPKNQAARDLLADSFEQVGYQQENPGLRNSFLAGAYELRYGLPKGASPKTSSPDLVRAISTELFLDFLAIRMDSRKAEGIAFKINLHTPDNGEKFIIELSNATLTSIKGYQDPQADLTMTLNRSDLEQVMVGAATFEKLIIEGKAKLQGDAKVLQRFGSTLSQFEIGFEILPGTVGAIPAPTGNPFAIGPVNPRGE